jgi:hypothetical protein
MTNFLQGVLLLTAALSSPGVAFAYSHANRYGGTTSHSEGSTTATGAYGSSATHTAGQGTTVPHRRIGTDLGDERVRRQRNPHLRPGHYGDERVWRHGLSRRG